MSFAYWCDSDVGLKRETNQDSYLVDQKCGLFVVADGMGGHSGGEVASSMAVETVSQVVSATLQANPNVDPRALVVSAYREASERIFAKSEVDAPELKGMGTTLVMALLRGNSLYVGNVGDSRAYMYTPPHLWLLTEDHSLINEQIRAGLLNESNAHLFVARNVITRSVGFERQVECDVIERKVQPGEMFLLCSDGLTSLVDAHRIAEILRTTAPEQVVAQCILEAKAQGGDDNVTVVLVQIRDGGAVFEG